jgi:hypothetical protein
MSTECRSRFRRNEHSAQCNLLQRTNRNCTNTAGTSTKNICKKAMNMKNTEINTTYYYWLLMAVLHTFASKLLFFYIAVATQDYSTLELSKVNQQCIGFNTVVIIWKFEQARQLNK